MRRESLQYSALDADSLNRTEKVADSKVDQTQAHLKTPVALASSVSTESNHATEHKVAESQSFDTSMPSSVASSFQFTSFPSSLPRIFNLTSRTPSATNTTPLLPRGNDFTRGIFSVKEEIDEEDVKGFDKSQRHDRSEDINHNLRRDISPAHDRHVTSSRKATIYRRRSRRWHSHHNLRPSTSSSSSSTCSSNNSNCNTTPSTWLSPLARWRDGFEGDATLFTMGDLSSTTQQVLKEIDDETDESDTGLSNSPWKSPPSMHTKLLHADTSVEGGALVGDGSDIHNNDSILYFASSHFLWPPQESNIHGAFTPFQLKSSEGKNPDTLNEHDESHNVDDLSPISPCKPFNPTDKDTEDTPFPFQFETQYSPIPTVSEEYVRCCLTDRVISNDTTLGVDVKMDNRGNDQHSFFPHYDHFMRNNSIISQPYSDVDMPNDDIINKSLDTSFMSNQSDASSTSTSKQQKHRPMPDLSAFDMGSSEVTTPSTSIQSSETVRNPMVTNTDGAVVAGERRRPHSFGSNASRMGGSNKWLCPPTPARTPAWAQGDVSKSLNRTDSLIATKILATCPQHILDGLSSLENSFMEEGEHSRSASGSTYSDLPQHTGSVNSNRDKSLMISFATVMEEDEADLSTNSLEIKSSTRYENQPISGSGTVVAATDNDDRSFLLVKRRHTSPLDMPFHDESPSLQNIYTHSHKLIKSDKRPSDEYAGEDNSVRLDASKSSSYDQSPIGSTISFHNDFEVLAQLGSGSFADVFKARCKSDGHIYAIKRSRRRFRGKRDRDRNLAEVRIMQQLQTIPPKSDGRARTSHFCIYLLFFIRAWQEDAHFFCQTELCCRDSCRHLLLSLTSDWDISSIAYRSMVENLQLRHPGDNSIHGDVLTEHLIPEQTIWKICHDVSAGLCYIHSHNIVHLDIKPENIFFISHLRLGAICKIGDFGLARSLDAMDDGEEGDTAYMASELLLPSKLEKPKSCDIFSLGLTLYELSSTSDFDLPLEGPRWHELRSGHHIPTLPLSRSQTLKNAIQSMMSTSQNRPSAESILTLDSVDAAGSFYDKFLCEYIRDVEIADLEKDKHLSQMQQDSR